ncbi:hypothetical protein CMUS01_06465 [Colletotrichum musicola]|uniref:Uncharacterized protein n=1 Tax=Colletotrichum musicola TaxID=2175873 RepID=A0A8H6NI48_9PEZI|nr:hypothetical protein CMUS01_06465 [Colletotrichum musicola]
MEDLKQLDDPIFPLGCKSSKPPPIPEKTPFRPVAANDSLADMYLTYSAVLKSSHVVDEESSLESISETSSVPDAMGFTKVDMPAPVLESGNGPQSRGPRQALPKGLVATRFSNTPTPRPAPRPQSSASNRNSSTFVECDLIDLETDVSTTPKRIPEQDGAKPPHRVEKDAGLGQELRLRREIAELRQKLASSNARAEIAEETADRMRERIEEIKNTKVSSVTETERDINSARQTVRELEVENSSLKEQLGDAQSHIFSLQPYRQELTPEEVGREYDDLVDGITDWVAKLMAPLLDDHGRGVDDLLMNARKRPTEAGRLKRMVRMHPDLCHGVDFPETDEDVIIAIIMRFLDENIFQKILYGALPTEVQTLTLIETSMQNHVEPKRDLFAIRTWSAEAYNAILSAHQFKKIRAASVEHLTRELASIFSILCARGKEESFHRQFEKHCIKPAMMLYEKMQVSTHHFYFDMNPYIMWGPEGELLSTPDFVDNLHDLDCRNILQNRKAFNVTKMDPPPTKRALYEHLLNVCTLAPALMMRQVGRKDVIREPQVVRRQQMLVAYGPVEKRDSFQKDGDQTLLSHLCSAKSERERAEAGGWSPFRWAG